MEILIERNFTPWGNYFPRYEVKLYHAVAVVSRRSQEAVMSPLAGVFHIDVPHASSLKYRLQGKTSTYKKTDTLRHLFPVLTRTDKT